MTYELTEKELKERDKIEKLITLSQITADEYEKMVIEVLGNEIKRDMALVNPPSAFEDKDGNINRATEVELKKWKERHEYNAKNDTIKNRLKLIINEKREEIIAVNSQRKLNKKQGKQDIKKIINSLDDNIVDDDTQGLGFYL